jgi:hypothetical protein
MQERQDDMIKEIKLITHLHPLHGVYNKQLLSQEEVTTQALGTNIEIPIIVDNQPSPKVVSTKKRSQKELINSNDKFMWTQFKETMYNQ